MAALRSLSIKCRKTRTHLTTNWNPRDSSVIVSGRKAPLSLWLKRTTRVRATQITVSTQSMKSHMIKPIQCSLDHIMTQTSLGTSPYVMTIKSRSKDQGSSHRCHPRALPSHYLLLRRKTRTKGPRMKRGACSYSQWARNQSLKAAKTKPEAAVTTTRPSSA